MEEEVHTDPVRPPDTLFFEDVRLWLQPEVPALSSTNIRCLKIYVAFKTVRLTVTDRNQPPQ